MMQRQQLESADGLIEAPWSLPADEVTAHWGVDPAVGLKSAEARRRLERFGPNQLREAAPKSKLRQFLKQFADWMIGLLAAAALISGLTGEWQDSALIAAIVLVNAIIGFVQEQRAERAVAALKQLSQPTARVRRDGSIAAMPSSELALGDIVELTVGALVPADARVLVASELQVQEAPLTGESMPVDKQVEPVGKATPLPERTDMVYAGTAILRGHGLAVVTATGMETEIGQIASMLESAETVQTPLQGRLAALSRRLAVIVIVVCCVVFMVGMLRGDMQAGELFLLAVSLAVAAIPEGLPAVITIALALGSQRMSKRRAIVRQLAAVETLGSVDVICSDKTGTLTENKMAVSDVVAYRDDAELRQELLLAGVLCNDAQVDGQGKAVGSATEVALLRAAERESIDVAASREQWPRVAEFPFSSQRKMMSSVHRGPDKSLIVFAKGAPEVVLRRVTHMAEGADASKVSAEQRIGLEELHLELAGRGRRVLAIAQKVWNDADPPDSAEQAEADLALLGFVGISDPPREEAKSAIATCKEAGIRVVMITGDHQRTATALAQELGLMDGDVSVLSGAELDDLDDEGLRHVAPKAAVYARVSPFHKLRIVQAHQALGSVVSMTGDGVNDAPALKQADIGVAMGITGTDVSKEAARMVLADDNFATIVAAIEEGRVVYDNIRKFVVYLLTTNTSEIVLILTSILLGLPLPLLPVHLLWINLVTDGPSALALAFEPIEPGAMRRKPRQRSEGIFAGGLARNIVLYGSLIAGACLGVYWWFLHRAAPPADADPHIYARSVVFSAVAISQLLYVLGLRSSSESLFRLGFISNWRLTVAVLLGLVLQLAVVYVPVLQGIFHTTSVPLADLPYVFLPAMIALAAVELQKLVRRRAV